MPQDAVGRRRALSLTCWEKRRRSNSLMRPFDAHTVLLVLSILFRPPPPPSSSCLPPHSRKDVEVDNENRPQNGQVGNVAVRGHGGNGAGNHHQQDRGLGEARAAPKRYGAGDKGGQDEAAIACTRWQPRSASPSVFFGLLLRPVPGNVREGSCLRTAYACQAQVHGTREICPGQA